MRQHKAINGPKICLVNVSRNQKLPLEQGICRMIWRYILVHSTVCICEIMEYSNYVCYTDTLIQVWSTQTKLWIKVL